MIKVKGLENGLCRNILDGYRQDESTFVKGIGFVWQGFGSRASTGVASVRRSQKLPLFLKNCSPWEGLIMENFMED